MCSEAIAMDTWKCNECNMKFETKSLYETHKRKFCGLLGELPGPTPPRSGACFEYLETNRGRKSRSPKQSLSLLSARSQVNTPTSSHGTQRMSDLEKEKVEELKVLKASKSLQRGYEYLKTNTIPNIKVSRQSSHDIMETTVFDDQMKQLQINHEEQLDQLKAHNERLQHEKLEIQERMNTLRLKSRQKLVSQGSVDKQAAEFEGLKKFLDYKSKELSVDYQTEMKKLNDLRKKTYQSGSHMAIVESSSPISRSSPVSQAAKSTYPHHFAVSTPQPMIIPYQSSYNNVVPQKSGEAGLMAEINAMKVSYLHGGGGDPMILSQITQLEQEAENLQPAPKAVTVDPVVQQQIMQYHLANQRLEHELQLLRMEKQQSDGLRKTPELSADFQRLKAQHLEKMTELKHESEMLKQLTEIERMKRELQELRGEKITSPEPSSKQSHETPFLLSTSGMENNLTPSPYDPSAGFSIFWDFLLGLSHSYTKCRLAVGIYNGNELISDVKVLPMVSVVKQQQPPLPSGGVAVLGITHPFPKCAPIQTLCIIAELQANSTDDKEADPHKLLSKGWTKMDLFEVTDRLISGRWKIPFRVPPIKTHLSSYELNRIPQVGMAELYIRLVNARDVRHEEMFIPQPLHFYLYKFPPLVNPALQQFSGHQIASLPSTTAATEHLPLPPPSVPPPPDTPGAVSLASIRSNQSATADSVILGIQVDQLCDAIDGEVKLKITGYNKLDGEILKAEGDTPVTCVTKSAKQDFLKDIYVFGLQEALFRHVQWNSQSIFIVRVYLQPSNQTQALKTNLLDESKLAAWTLVPVAQRSERTSRQGRTSAVQLNTGKHCLPLFFPPVPDVTTLPNKVTQYPEEWNRYGPAALQMTLFSGFQRPLERPKTPSEFIDENEFPQNSWIKNGRSSAVSQEFTAGSGFDLYIDGARFLPDSITYTKVAGRTMDKNYNKIGPDIEVQSKLYSDIFNPDYDYRIEFREPVFPITSMLVVKLYTVDQITKSLLCVGYSVLPIFLKLGTTTAPTNNSDSEKVALNEGSHQIRVYNGVPDFTQPLSLSIVNKLTPVPCASLLVRIVRAASHPNGRPKEISQFQESEWEKEGLVVPKQSYQTGLYYSLSCEPSLGECQILNSMVLRHTIYVRDAIKLTAVVQDKAMKKDEVIASWIKTQLTRSIDVAPPDFDLNYVSVYHTMHGIKVSVDGAQNLPWSSFTFATFCLSPPGAFYKGDQADPISYSSRLVYSSDVSSPVWLDGVKTFPRRLLHRYLVLVIHLHEVIVEFLPDHEKYGLKGQAWAVVPVFNEGYVMNGSYQLPLYQGEPSEPFLNALQQDNCHDVLAAFRRKKTIKYLEGSSVLVRLSDARREEELPQPRTRVKQDYLPKEKLSKYTMVNPSKPISSLLPAGLAEVDFSYTLPGKLKELMKQVFAKILKNINEKEIQK